MKDRYIRFDYKHRMQATFLLSLGDAAWKFMREFIDNAPVGTAWEITVVELTQEEFEAFPDED
ncbi:MAG TPA: hypothetical protein VGS58_21530 [Candidatus Sulfopaludibacter sp.]|nr:hypothetical protein [Candidatus Sulfopaludibacter sp.]